MTTRTNCASYVAPKQLLSQYFFNGIVPAAGAAKLLYRLVMRVLRFADFFKQFLVLFISPLE
jgi:hypothetical protein